MSKLYIITEDEAEALQIHNREWEEDAVCPVAAGLYLTRGDGVAVPVTAEMLRAALGWHHSSACNTSAFVKSDGPCNCDAVARAERILAKLLEQPR